ncbi:hypothetical protein [Aurantibacter sp.]|uniref:hypothetical protein n=1 Tax=Aurantibacter sp. TaxID=2807103 RepID=UPI003266A5B5
MDSDKQLAYQKNILSKGITIEYLLSEYNKEKDLYVDVKKEIEINPERSALVLIDVWEDSFLDSITIKNINPIVEELSDLGMKIVYAPSHLPQNKNLNILEEGVFFYNQDMIDQFVLKNKIENLFYVGADNFYCLLDKPNGIYSFLSRNESVKAFVVDKGSFSFTKEMKAVAAELLKKNGVGYVHSYEQGPELVFPRKTVTGLTAKTEDKINKGSNIIVMFKNGKEQTAIENFENSLDKSKVFYAVVEKDKMFIDEKEVSPSGFIKLIHDNKIRNIYYGGYYLNNEILWSDFGLIALYIKMRYAKVNAWLQLNVINDLTFITPCENLDPNLEKATIINHFRILDNVMSTTLLNGIERISNPDSQEISSATN